MTGSPHHMIPWLIMALVVSWCYVRARKVDVARQQCAVALAALEERAATVEMDVAGLMQRIHRGGELDTEDALLIGRVHRLRMGIAQAKQAHQASLSEDIWDSM